MPVQIPRVWLLEARGNERPRGMVATVGPVTGRPNRTRLTVHPGRQPADPPDFGKRVFPVRRFQYGG